MPLELTPKGLAVLAAAYPHKEADMSDDKVPFPLDDEGREKLEDAAETEDAPEKRYEVSLIQRGSAESEGRGIAVDVTWWHKALEADRHTLDSDDFSAVSDTCAEAEQLRELVDLMVNFPSNQDAMKRLLDVVQRKGGPHPDDADVPEDLQHIAKMLRDVVRTEPGRSQLCRALLSGLGVEVPEADEPPAPEATGDAGEWVSVPPPPIGEVVFKPEWDKRMRVIGAAVARRDVHAHGKAIDTQDVEVMLVLMNQTTAVIAVDTDNCNWWKSLSRTQKREAAARYIDTTFADDAVAAATPSPDEKLDPLADCQFTFGELCQYMALITQEGTGPAGMRGRLGVTTSHPPGKAEGSQVLNQPGGERYTVSIRRGLDGPILVDGQGELPSIAGMRAFLGLIANFYIEQDAEGRLTPERRPLSLPDPDEEE